VKGAGQILGAHVLGEYSAEVTQMVAACMAAGIRVEEVAELQLAFPAFTEGVGMAAQMLVRELGVRAMPQLWSSLSHLPEGLK
jgi:Pyridine nucleotide-disulphide oxidoreductase, dimerisation domain